MKQVMMIKFDSLKWRMIDEYDHPIYECGVHLADMVYLQRPL